MSIPATINLDNPIDANGINLVPKFPIKSKVNMLNK